MISKSSLCRTLAVGVFIALQIGIAAAQAVREEYSFTIPPGYWLSVRVGFGTEWEQNLVLRRRSGDRIGQWNNYSTEPDRRHLGPWRETNTKVPTEVYFTDYHKEGKSRAELRWLRSDAHVVTPPTLLPDKKTTYTVVQWSDGSAKNAVTVEMRISPDKNVAGDLFKTPSPAPANAPK